jgi:hypothetical protein
VLLTVPYYSLSRAYASRGQPAAPISVMFYRAWLIPMSELAKYVLFWAITADPSANVMMLVFAAALVWFLLLFSSMLATARMASGVGPFASLLVVIVPFVVLSVGWPLAMRPLEQLLPEPISAESG